MTEDTLALLVSRMSGADKAFGNFASTHEALGVALEEWDEFRDAIRTNDRDGVQYECLDLAAVLIRLHDQLEDSALLRARSGMEP
jgi:NTP pyrophosphatase (non-canonical NTP hydrolase)